MTPDEKREVFRQSMLVIEKIEAVSMAHSDKNGKRMVEDYLHTNPKIASGTEQGNDSHTFISTWFAYIKRRQFIPALVSAFVLLFTGATSLLADQALPGDSLYSFKVNVNEPARELAAVTNEARAKLAVEVTERRLQEAAVLSSQGKLDEGNKKILQDQFVKHADQIRNRVASLVASNNLNAAQEVVVDFESALKTHELILESLSLAGDKADQAALALLDVSSSTPAIAINSGSTSTTSTLALAKHDNRAGVSALLIAVKSELDNTKVARIGIEEKVLASLTAVPATTSTSAGDITPAQVIESNIKELRFTMYDIQVGLKTHTYSTSTLDVVNRRLDLASTSIASIDALLKANQITEAVGISRTVLKNLAEVETLLKLERTSGTMLEGKVDISTIFGDTKTGSSTTASSTAPTNDQATSGTIGQ